MAVLHCAASQVRIALFGLVASAIASSSVAAASPQASMTRVSVDSSGNQGNSQGSTHRPSVSRYGRLVAFNSLSTNLVPGDTNGTWDVFVHDRQTSITSRVSVDSTGLQGNGSSFDAWTSANGRFVAFTSAATNLVPGDTNGSTDVFVHDRANGQTTRVSLAPGGVQAVSGAFEPSLSADGRFVAFLSYSPDLVPNDTNSLDVFVHDRVLGTNTRVNVTSSGAQSNGPGRDPTISHDGRFVAFSSTSTNLVPGDTNGLQDIFVHDLQTGATLRVVSATGVEPNRDCFSPMISGNGRSVVFFSRAHVFTGELSSWEDVFVYDVATRRTRKASVTANGQTGSLDSGYPSISADGRFVGFSSIAPNLAPGGIPYLTRAFVKDMQTGEVLALTSGANGGGDVEVPVLSEDGGRAAFTSLASTLVPGDTNGCADTFFHDRGRPCGTARPYCTGAITTLGCTPAMHATGLLSASQPSTLLLHCEGLEGQTNGLIYYGASGRQALPWGSGSTSVACVKPPAYRTQVQSSAGTAGHCDGSITLDWTAFVASHPGVPGTSLAAGQSYQAQTWFRDPPAPRRSNLSQAIEFAVCP